MKTLVSLILSLFIFPSIQKSKLGFGEGVITIAQYTFPDVRLIPTDLSSLKASQSSYFFTYYIKGCKILRKDLPSDTAEAVRENAISKGTVLTNTLQLNMVHPNYLIDWEKRLTYTFFKNNGIRQISEKLLRDENTEYFYRLIDSNKTTIISLGKSKSTYIVNLPCIEGVALTKSKDTLRFYYTPTSFKVHSPLNSYLPAEFPYEVLCIKASVNWTGKDGKPGIGVILFQVSGYKEGKQPDSLFTLPANMEIRKNVPWQEIYSPQ
ncbi:hypothetical protein SAMN05518672_1011332 [Chitinophaga sp. CF118]|uniref:hypothetical protein n=1 Tax=Chitinophaga sp. CF118 TaxID=1884367 RepID=UPI0008E0C5E9|nr:hypothetical protein [Chitinophaga sp. CF118]SFD26173.1 hypothetical protein SAMN05518672_1011332 [Chitinophaga sp. CF118]